MELSCTVSCEFVSAIYWARVQLTVHVGSSFSPQKKMSILWLKNKFIHLMVKEEFDFCSLSIRFIYIINNKWQRATNENLCIYYYNKIVYFQWEKNALTTILESCRISLNHVKIIYHKHERKFCSIKKNYHKVLIALKLRKNDTMFKHQHMCCFVRRKNQIKYFWADLLLH